MDLKKKKIFDCSSIKFKKWWCNYSNNKNSMKHKYVFYNIFFIEHSTKAWIKHHYKISQVLSSLQLHISIYDTKNYIRDFTWTTCTYMRYKIKSKKCFTIRRIHTYLLLLTQRMNALNYSYMAVINDGWEIIWMDC